MTMLSNSTRGLAAIVVRRHVCSSAAGSSPMTASELERRVRKALAADPALPYSTILHDAEAKRQFWIGRRAEFWSSVRHRIVLHCSNFRFAAVDTSHRTYGASDK